jgi:hypothetical protein
MDPMPAGCIQEDDPRYGASNFNDFGRIDNFDSDLWTNDERFTASEVEAALAAGAPLDVPATILESRGITVFAPVPVPAPVTTSVPVPVPAPATTSESLPTPVSVTSTTKSQFYSISADNNIIEIDWLSELFGQKIAPNDIHTLTVGKQLDHIPICIVNKPHMDFWESLFTVWSAIGQSFYAVHLSDEYNVRPDSIHWYKLPNCKGIIRNYPRGDIPEAVASKVTVIPLGYARGRGPTGPITRSADRRFAWSFEGTAWADRAAKLRHLQDAGLPHELIFRNTWESPARDSAEYNSLLDSSKIIPVPAGNNSETFRIWEAIEHGCIPLYVRESGDDVYWQFITSRLPIFAAPNWESAGEFAKMLLGNDRVLDMYRDDLVSKWTAWKDEIKAAVRAWIA